MQFRPKGSMCMNCERLKHYCGDLDFENMPVIEVSKDGCRIVKCTSFARKIEELKRMSTAH